MDGHSELERMRHSAAHLMAAAVQSLWPEAKFGVGPAIRNGFYYDMELPVALTPKDLERIEQRMRELRNQKLPYERIELPIEAAIAEMARRGQDYKVELLGLLKEKGSTAVAAETGDADAVGVAEGEGGVAQVSFYRTGDFLDLCRGPHVAHTGEIGAFKLTSIAGAYWRGNEKNPQLQRIYGIAFPTKEELERYLWQLEEAERRDHRTLGKQLHLFSVQDEIGAGLILWHPRGARVRKLIEDYWFAQHLARDYQVVYSPHVGKAQLWQTSGHLDFFRENMYAPMEMDEVEYFAKPMNCPFHIKIYQSELRSYRDLPIRLTELGTVYRYEKPGVLHGLLRVRGFTQDDAHIFCRPDQVEAEIGGVLDFALDLLAAFGFKEYEIYLSTRPEKAVGEEADWEMATAALRMALEARNLPYAVDAGGGAFYGPKIDLKIRDALDRTWQCTTVQFDFNEPVRFGMKYIGEDGREHRPYMVHRALLGSIERFFGVLIEHYAGAFPVWLAPVQAIVIPIADRHLPYAETVVRQLRAADLRVELDARGERMNAKIRDAQLQKIPYMLTVGDREAGAGAVAVRLRSGEVLPPMAVAEFVALAQKAVAERA